MIHTLWWERNSIHSLLEMKRTVKVLEIQRGRKVLLASMDEAKKQTWISGRAFYHRLNEGEKKRRKSRVRQTTLKPWRGGDEREQSCLFLPDLD